MTNSLIVLGSPVGRHPMNTLGIWIVKVFVKGNPRSTKNVLLKL